MGEGVGEREGGVIIARINARRFKSRDKDRSTFRDWSLIMERGGLRNEKISVPILRPLPLKIG